MNNTMKYIQGDIFEYLKTDMIQVMMHQTNCVGAFNAGIARIVRKKYPNVHQHYQTKLTSTKEFIDSFGTHDFIKIADGYMVNLYGQYFPGKPKNLPIKSNTYMQDSLQTRLEMLEKAMESAKKDIPENFRIGIPLIASGIAKSDESKYKKMSDLDYFKKVIAPVVEKCFFDRDLMVFYL